jgi:hypothetical protein
LYVVLLVSIALNFYLHCTSYLQFSLVLYASQLNFYLHCTSYLQFSLVLYASQLNVYLLHVLCPCNLILFYASQLNFYLHCTLYLQFSLVLYASQLNFYLLHVLCPCNYPLANKVAKGYKNATVRPSFHPSFRNILVNTIESTSFNGFWPNLVDT